MHIIVFCVVTILLPFGASSNVPDGKEAIRADFKRSIGRIIRQNDPREICLSQISLTAEQKTFVTIKTDEFVKCIMTTADALFDRLDDDITKADFQDLSKGRKIFPHICNIFDDGHRCAQIIDPVIDLCMDSEVKQAKRNLLPLASMVQESMCAENGTIISDLVEQPDAARCIYITSDWLMGNGLFELLVTNTGDLFRKESDCVEFNRLQNAAAAEFRECTDSSELINASRRLLGYFCRATKCKQFVSDLQCFE